MNEPTNVQEHAPSPAAACSDPQLASERPDQPDNKAAGEGRVARLVRCSSFWVVDLDLIPWGKAPLDISHYGWLVRSVSTAWNALPEGLRPRAVLISSRHKPAYGGLVGLLDMFDLEGIPVISTPLQLRSLDAHVNRVAKQDPALLDDVVCHLKDLVSVADNNWMRLKVPCVNELPVGGPERVVNDVIPAVHGAGEEPPTSPTPHD